MLITGGVEQVTANLVNELNNYYKVHVIFYRRSQIGFIS